MRTARLTDDYCSSMHQNRMQHNEEEKRIKKTSALHHDPTSCACRAAVGGAALSSRLAVAGGMTLSSAASWLPLGARLRPGRGNHDRALPATWPARW